MFADHPKSVRIAPDAKPDVTESPPSPFSLLLKQNKGLRLGPKATVEVPVSFAPTDVRSFEATLSIVIHKEDATGWPYVCTDAQG